MNSNRPDACGAKDRSTLRLAYWVAFVAAFIQVVAMSYLAWPLSSNDRSRWDTVWALTHGQGYIVDAAPYGGVDRVFHNGHYYSSKPPLLPTVVGGIVWCIDVTLGWRLPTDESYIIPAVLIFLNVIPNSLIIVLYGKLLASWDLGAFANTVSLMTAGFGTYLFPYCISFNNHTVAAIAVFITLYSVLQIEGGFNMGSKYFVIAGLFSAWAVTAELLAALFSVCICVWLVCRHPLQTVQSYVPAAFCVLGMFFTSLYISTGGVIPFYLREDLYHYPGSYWDNPQGINAARDPWFIYAFNILLGHHGYFSLTPIFLIVIFAGLKACPYKPLTRLTVLLSLSLLLFLLVKTRNYGGGCHGLRWGFWLIPLYMILLPWGVSAYASSARGRVFVGLILAISIYSACGALKGERGPWGTSWIHWNMRYAGLVHY